MIMPWIRIPTLIITIAAIIVWWLWTKKKHRVIEASPIFLWLVNVTIYQIVRLYISSTLGDVLSYWGAGVILQAALSLLAIGYIMLLESKHHE